jgi:hypothetical protein
MEILPGLTSTKPERIGSFIEDAARLAVRRIALFPTCLDPGERAKLYRELERLPALAIPHVHLRADADLAEMDYLAERFRTEAFNIHPRRSSHPFCPLPPKYARRIFVENVDAAPEAEELALCGGLCLDFSHWENAKRFKTNSYSGFQNLAQGFPIGCAHVSAFREGFPNLWSGGWDHHEFASLSDMDYMAAYRDFLPSRWVSLELENSLPQQLEAAARLLTVL